VLAHEDDVLKNGYGTELAATKREYYRICVGLVEGLVKADGLKSVGSNAAATGGINTRTAVMGLFGMMNWLYTWYNPRVDPDAEVLAREISDIFLRGIRAGKMASKPSIDSLQREPVAGRRRNRIHPKRPRRPVSAENKHAEIEANPGRRFQRWVAPSQPRPKPSN